METLSADGGISGFRTRGGCVIARNTSVHIVTVIVIKRPRSPLFFQDFYRFYSIIYFETMTATKQKSSSHTISKIKNFVNALLLLLVCEKQQYKVST